MEERAGAFARVMISVGLPIALAGPILAGPLITGFFGEAYSPAATALGLLMVNAGIVYLAMSVGNPLMAWNHERPYMWAIAVGAASNVILNVALIPSFGIEGAAFATLASEAVVLTGLVRAYRRVARIRYESFVTRAVVATVTGAVAPALLGRFMDLPLAVTLALVLVGYGTAMWGAGCIRVLNAAPKPASAHESTKDLVGPGTAVMAPGVSPVT
jgi:O-antigen/teichoic acid export membrane protein